MYECGRREGRKFERFVTRGIKLKERDNVLEGVGKMKRRKMLDKCFENVNCFIYEYRNCVF